MGTVAGAVPTFLERIPVDHAPHMGARCRTPDDNSILALIAGHLDRSGPHNCSLAWCNLVDRADLGWTDMLGQMSDRLDLAVHKLRERWSAGERFSSRIEHRCIPAVLTDDERQDRKAAGHSVGNPLTGIAGMNIDISAPG